MTVRLMCDTAYGRAGALVTVDERDGDRLVRAGAAFPVQRMLTPETATAVPSESAAQRDARPSVKRKGRR